MFDIHFAALLCVLWTSIAAAQDPPYYLKRGTWEGTARASFDTLAIMRNEGQSPGSIDFGPWLSIGPFRGTTRTTFADSYPPEYEFLPQKTYSDGKFAWTSRPSWHDGTIIRFPETDYAMMYLNRSIRSTRDTVIALSLGSDDGLKIWLDGILIFSHDIARGVAPDQDQLDLHLTTGEHRLLARVYNQTGGFGFYFKRVDREDRTIWQLLHRDFNQSNDVRDMQWERQDSIWVTPWRAKDSLALIRRYVTATLFETPEERVSSTKALDTGRQYPSLDSVRNRYIASKIIDATPVILTPKPSGRAQIHGPAIFGVRPEHPFIYTIPATGDRPIRFSVQGLPRGLHCDSLTGRITGALRKRGKYHLTLRARNGLGSSSKLFTVFVGDEIALTPPLGWNSWNCFATAVDDQRVRLAADAMVRSALAQHGWTYINIDDCWEMKPGSDDTLLAGEPRTPEGKIRTNRKFPDMDALSRYIHEKGLKLGIYSSPGPLTCGGYAGSYGHEELDAEQYAGWGVDYLKYDWCSYGEIEKERTLPALQKPYLVMRRALDKIDRDIVFSLCQYGWGDVWTWGASVGGNSWRTTGDIEDTWQSMSGIGFSQADHERYADRGHWNDPDMLVVGMVGWGPTLHPTRLTPNEQYTHISLWCLLSAPLLIGCDMTQLDEFTLNLLSNDEVLAVNQDPGGKQAGRIMKEGESEVWAKDLSDGSKAVGLFNRGQSGSRITVVFRLLDLHGKQRVRDLWRQTDLGVVEGSYTTLVPRHGVVLLKLSMAK
jgi:alpha-galactosidase